ncbi:carbohydrate sulfotransferase 1-like [Oppia nitens]|uniref:carbohydrate sulfotransferase 1-like n=1 Tax=Oppia nitens TaxID=1686743 RepID=UPI0023DB0C84|nr:carbohydrate sulfotransferase 1-like [Oppia nitens]
MRGHNKTERLDICNKCQTSLVKALRAGVDHYLSLYKKSVSQIKLVMLVRDPRGTMASRYDPNLVWCTAKHCKNITTLCRLMRLNINQLLDLKQNSRIAKDIVLVRYEELSTDVQIKSKQLFNFLNIKHNFKVKTWIKNHTTRDKNRDNPHSGIRDSYKAAFQWTKRLNKTMIIKIQNECSDVMKNLGYKLIDFSIDKKYDQKKYHLNQLLTNHYPLDYLSNRVFKQIL